MLAPVSLSLCVHNVLWKKNPGILTQPVKGNPSGSDLVFGAWSPKWGAHSGLFVYPSLCSGLSQAITWCPLLLSDATVSLLEGLRLSRTGVMLGLNCTMEVIRKVAHRQGSRLHRDNQNKSADLMTESSFQYIKKKDISSFKINLESNKLLTHKKAASCKLIRCSFYLNFGLIYASSARSRGWRPVL